MEVELESSCMACEKISNYRRKEKKSSFWFYVALVALTLCAIEFCVLAVLTSSSYSCREPIRHDRVVSSGALGWDSHAAPSLPAHLYMNIV